MFQKLGLLLSSGEGMSGGLRVSRLLCSLVFRIPVDKAKNKSNSKNNISSCVNVAKTILWYYTYLMQSIRPTLARCKTVLRIKKHPVLKWR
jgi:hypothetical protein